VAIKAISLDALKSQRLEALVFEEIRILQMMDHQNVLRLREALLSDRNCYIVTELCPHGNLEERLRRGPMGDVEIGSVMLQLVEGLRYLRSVGVVHRDFKTANIFLSGSVAKIADFGLAKLYK
jgi:serine/threonine protein kinase